MEGSSDQHDRPIAPAVALTALGHAEEEEEEGGHGELRELQGVGGFVPVPADGGEPQAFPLEGARHGEYAEPETVARWAEGFVTDTGFGTAGDVTTMLARLAAGDIRVWVDDDVPVAMGMSAPVAYGVSRVGWIYTPLEHRGRGYGSAVTAAVTAEQLAGDATTCMLYAQLGNPTSNRIYRRLGYRAVSEDLGYDFGS